MNSDSDVKPYVFCSTNSYLHTHSDSVSLNDIINSDSLTNINSESLVDTNSDPDFKRFSLCTRRWGTTSLTATLM